MNRSDSTDYLFCPCPAANCNNSNKNPRYWYHANGCGGATKIRYSNIHICCSTCNRNGILFDWKFQCEDHTYRAASKQGILYALAIMGLHKGNEDRIREAVQAIMNNWPKN